MSLAEIDSHAAAHALMVMGALHEGAETVVLLGPREPEFWRHVTAQPEMQDGAANPLDRWSKRAIGDIAKAVHAVGTAFPSDGPPYAPFISWALASGRCWLSPAGLLIHDTAGLMVSFRGALRMAGHLDLPMSSPSPCDSCSDQHCTTACPVSALQAEAYDVPACQTHIRTSDTAACGTTGCAARRACPVSQSYGRLPAQSAFHMRAFLGE